MDQLPISPVPDGTSVLAGEEEKEMDYNNDTYSWIPFLDEDDPLPGQICPYAATSEVSIKTMIEIASPTPDDIVVDLGCGDGRIVIQAAKIFGIRGVGLDINPELIESANRIAKEEGVEHLVCFKLLNFAQDSFDFTLKSMGFQGETPHIYPTLITCYLIPKALKTIEPKLKSLLRNLNNNQEQPRHKDIRISSIVFNFERWQEIDKNEKLKIYLYDKTSADVVPKSTDSANPIFI
ncbi:hypothetical protein CYY_001535 [Polysphondylium violaceum]|uniref:Methyltransferase domain-containing protein n=1 Tax=Polysphondylium violaceum TaxID=133409 RepID=A0A8J4Q0W5_9MYCE|nr:hypothetical protein CYY_001535 [Polysphondylium violaceum]